MHEDALDLEGLGIDGGDVARLQGRLARVGDGVAVPVGVPGRVDDRAVDGHAQVVGPEAEVDDVLPHRLDAARQARQLLLGPAGDVEGLAVRGHLDAVRRGVLALGSTPSRSSACHTDPTSEPAVGGGAEAAAGEGATE